MNEGNILSRVIQVLGLTFTVATIVLQFFYRSEFRDVFGVSNKIYFEAFSATGLIFSILIIIALYTFRYSINLRYHPQFNKYKQYLEYARNQSQGPKDKKVKFSVQTEPFYVDGKRFGVLAFTLALVFFPLIFIIPNPIAKSLFYLLFLLFSVASVVVFLMVIYLEEDYKRNLIAKRKALISRINESTAPKFTIIREYYNDINIFNPVIEMTIRIEGKGDFIVVANANNVDRMFNIYPVAVQPVTPIVSQ